jgi:IQ calmodulin-binding motif
MIRIIRKLIATYYPTLGSRIENFESRLGSLGNLVAWLSTMAAPSETCHATDSASGESATFLANKKLSVASSPCGIDCNMGASDDVVEGINADAGDQREVPQRENVCDTQMMTPAAKNITHFWGINIPSPPRMRRLFPSQRWSSPRLLPMITSPWTQRSPRPPNHEAEPESLSSFLSMLSPSKKRHSHDEDENGEDVEYVVLERIDPRPGRRPRRRLVRLYSNSLARSNGRKRARARSSAHRRGRRSSLLGSSPSVHDFASSLDWSFEEEKNVVYQTWRTVLALSALLDCSAMLLTEKIWWLPEVKNHRSATRMNLLSTLAYWIKRLQGTSVGRFFHRHAPFLGQLFSLLWFFDAFVGAAPQQQRRIARERETRHLLCSAQARRGTTKPRKKHGGSSLLDSTEGVSSLTDSSNFCAEDDLPVATEEVKLSWLSAERALGVYWGMVLLQCFFLPVGFYIGGYDKIVRAGQWILAKQFPDRFANVCHPDTVLRILQREGEADSSAIFLDVLSSSSNVSLGYALLKHLFVFLRCSTVYHRNKLQEYAITYLKANYVPILIRKAIWNPWSTRRQLQRTLQVVRWLTYLLPLVGACNKLFQNAMDLVRRIKQRRRRRRAKLLVRKMLSSGRDPDRAAIVIQTTFRGYRTRKRVHALKLLIGEKQVLAALQLQRVFRGMLHRARVRLERKFVELKQLEARPSLNQRRGHSISNEKTPTASLTTVERRRMFELHAELTTSAAKLVNHTLLLRPNSTFAVTWKALFVMAVVIEIAGLVLRPRLIEYDHTLHGRPRRWWGQPDDQVNIEHLLAQYLIPARWSELEECAPVKESNVIFIRWIKRLMRRVTGFQEIRGVEPAPWYCRPWAVRAQSSFVAVLSMSIDEFLEFLSFVCVLDVFVTFFTGQFNRDTGALEPTPPFNRWFVPGLTLQLLVNPSMDSVAMFISKVRSKLMCCERCHGFFRVRLVSTIHDAPYLDVLAIKSRGSSSRCSMGKYSC